MVLIVGAGALVGAVAMLWFYRLSLSRPHLRRYIYLVMALLFILFALREVAELLSNSDGFHAALFALFTFTIASFLWYFFTRRG